MAISSSSRRTASAEDCYFPEKRIAVPFQWEALPGRSKSHVEDPLSVPSIYPLRPPPCLVSGSPLLSPDHQFRPPSSPATPLRLKDVLIRHTPPHSHDQFNLPDSFDDFSPPRTSVVKFHSFRSISSPAFLLKNSIQQRSRSFSHALHPSDAPTARTPAIAGSLVNLPVSEIPSIRVANWAMERFKLRDLLQSNTRDDNAATSPSCGRASISTSKQLVQARNGQALSKISTRLQIYMRKSEAEELVEAFLSKGSSQKQVEGKGEARISSGKVGSVELSNNSSGKQSLTSSSPSNSLCGKLKSLLISECSVCWCPSAHAN